jgi:xanthine dehydrogenase YagR molybdenum-binding subunit
VTKRGDTTAALRSATIKLDGVYSTPKETHNAIELHASVAVYEDGKFTPYETNAGSDELSRCDGRHAWCSS